MSHPFFCSPAESDEEGEGEKDPVAGDAGGAAVAVEQKAYEREGKDDESDEIELLHGGEHPGNVGGWFCAGESALAAGVRKMSWMKAVYCSMRPLSGTALPVNLLSDSILSMRVAKTS